MIDCIYVSASAHDGRFTRICVASIRYFYPEVPIHLLPGGCLQPDLVRELREYWHVERAKLAEEGDYGWGFVKLEVLFGAPGERFLVLDSDTVLTGPVLDEFGDTHASFLVDDEKQSDVDTKRLYYDWEKVRVIDPCAQPPGFVFNSGQWFGTAGLLTRHDFAPWIEWTLPRRHRHPECFMPGDQGVLNYVFNRKVAVMGLQIERRRIMCWPAHSLEGLDVDSIAKGTASPRIVHWAGLKKARQRDMLAADLLGFFEKFYYSKLPAGGMRRLFAGCRHVLSQKMNESGVHAKLAIRKYLRNTKPPLAQAVPGTK